MREAGADAALLILRDLDDETARRLMADADDIGLDTLVEAHDAEELHRAIRLGAAVDRHQRARPLDVRDRPRTRSSRSSRARRRATA